MKTRILLVRHGATPFSAEERFAGSTDVDLSDEGRVLAELLGERLAGTKIDAVYASGMKRTMATAAIAAGPGRPDVVAAPGLREIGHGHWEGMVHREVEKKYAAEYAAWTADPFANSPPGGESGLQVLARALPAMWEIVMKHGGQTVLAVGHKATNRLLLCSLLGIDPRFYRERLAQDLACLNVIDFTDPPRAQVIVMNDTSHCDRPPAGLR